MFHVTVVNLSNTGRTPIEGGGPTVLGNMSADELTTLLNTFIEVDSVENLKAEPEVRVQNRRNRFVIRTGERRLFLQDARNLAEPAYVLTATEIIAELDGSAAAKRTTPPIPVSLPSDAMSSSGGTASGIELPPRPEEPERSFPWALLLLVLALAGYIGYTQWTSRAASAGPELTPLTTAERLTEDASLTGVYMTGSEPGQHGLVLLGDGKLKLFRVNAQAAPGVVYGTYRIGRLDGKLCVATDQPGGVIKVIDRQSLEFCGEIYKRIP